MPPGIVAPFRPPVDDQLTMDPPPVGTIVRRACLVPSITPSRFTDMIRWYSSTVTSSMRPANGPFLITWTDRRRTPEVDLFATEVDPDGTVGHPDGFPIATVGDLFPYPTAAAVTPSPVYASFTVAYDRNVPESPYGSIRVLLRRVAPK